MTTERSDLGDALLEHLDPTTVDVFARLGYVPTERQQVFHDSTAHAVLYGGALGGGKTKALLMEAIRACVRHRGIRVLAARRTYDELQESLLRELLLVLEVLEQEFGAVYKSSPNPELAFPNRSVIRFRYAETVVDASRRQGGEYQLIVFDEAGLVPGEVIEQLEERQRSGKSKLPVLGLRLASNPMGPGHGWLKERFIDPTENGSHRATDDQGRTVEFIPAKASDNPHLDEGYERQLDAIADPDRRRAMRDGDWDVLADAAFGDWRRERLVVDSFPLPASWIRFAGMDYGWTAPSVVLWAAQDEDGRMWLYDELTARQTPERQLAELVLAREHSALGLDVDRLVQVSVSLRSADPSMWTPKGPTIDVATALATYGVGLQRADNDRIVGKARVHSFLAEAPACAIHRAVGWQSCPMLHVLDGACPELVRTMPELVRDPRRPEDVLKCDRDHWYDAMRYLLMGVGGTPLVAHGRHEATAPGGVPIADALTPQIAFRPKAPRHSGNPSPHPLYSLVQDRVNRAWRR